MPRKRYRNRRRPPRRYRRYGRKRMGRRRNRESVAIVKSPTTISDRVFIRLKYSRTLRRTTVINLDNFYFNGNSAWQPDVVFGSHKPFGFNQWCGANAFYNKYRVHASKVVGTINNLTDFPLSFGVYPSISNAAPLGLDNLNEIPYARLKHVGPHTAATSRVVIKNFMTTRKIFGIKSISQEEDWAADYQHSPSDLWYWVFDANGLTIDGLDYSVTVKLTYYVEFFDRQQIGQS